MGKYKFKKRKKLISSYKILVVLCILLFFISSGYAYYSSTLKITGTVILEPEIVYGNSTYTYAERNDSPWPGSGNQKVYACDLMLTNLDQSYTDRLEISFDLPPGFNGNDSQFMTNLWQADSISINGNRVTILCKDDVMRYNIAYGQSTDIYIQVPYPGIIENFEVTNVTLHGLAVRCVN